MKLEQVSPFGRSFGRIRSGFELPDSTLGEPRIAIEIVRVEDRANIAQAVTADRSNLRLRRASKGQTSNRCSTEIVEGEALYAGSRAPLLPGGAEAIRRPDFARAVEQYSTIGSLKTAKHFLEGAADRNDNPRAGLALLQTNDVAITVTSKAPGDPPAVALSTMLR